MSSESTRDRESRARVEAILQDLLRVGRELLAQFADGQTPETAMLESALGKRSQLLDELHSQWQGLRIQDPRLAERLEETQLKDVREQDLRLREDLHNRLQTMRGDLDNMASCSWSPVAVPGSP